MSKNTIIACIGDFNSQVLWGCQDFNSVVTVLVLKNVTLANWMKTDERVLMCSYPKCLTV
jgi:hypothetical protein